jgi:imidazolonepropionase
MSIDLLIENGAEVFPATASGPIERGVVALEAGKVAYVGDLPGLGPVSDTVPRLDARGGLVTPGLVDPHTHIVFAGDRSGEYARRATGTSYLEIAAEGGGIAATMRATREADLDTLVALATPRLDRMLSNGVTTAEVKSGYGLDLETELRMLRAIRALDAAHPVELVPTFLGAHTVPPDRKHAAYLDDVVSRMLPAVAAEGLAEFCDVFVERGAFSIAEAERVLTAGLDHGLRPKLHADQLSAGGGAELAGRIGAVSADHLEYTSEAGIEALARAGTVAVLLPGAALFLGADDRAPARRLVDAGVRVALSTDCNPGTCMTDNLLLMLTLGMSRLGLSPREVLEAVTVHAARAIGREDVAGTLQVGRPADLVVFDVPSHRHLPYHFGAPHARLVLKGGREVFRRA